MRRNFVLVIIALLVVAGIYFVSKKEREIPLDTSPNDISQTSPSSNQNQETIEGIFEGITPCSNVEKPLPQIPSNANCEMTIWRITFNPDSTYTLNGSYGMTLPGTPGIKGGGTKITMEGNWTILKGTRNNPEAIVIQLNTDNPQTSVSFLKINKYLIHLLDNNKKMMVGNGGWSYTITKTSK